MKNQTGSAHALIIIVLVVAIIGALGFVVWKNVTKEEPVANSTPVVTAQTDGTCTEVFEEENIMKRFDFMASDGKEKSLIVYKVGENEYEIPKADTYVTADDLCMANAAQVAEMSTSDENEYGWGLTIQQNTIKEITVSPGEGKKYIVVSTNGPGDGSALTIVDEDGGYLGDVEFDYGTLVDQYGMIGFWTFEGWTGDTTFTATSGSASGAELRATVDASTAAVVNQPAKY